MPVWHPKGSSEIVSDLQAEAHVLRCLNQAMHQTASGYQYPDAWQPLGSAAKTELFEVHPGSPEVSQLVLAVQKAGAVVVKVITTQMTANITIAETS